MKRILMAVALFAVSAPAFALDLPGATAELKSKNVAPGINLAVPWAKRWSPPPATAFEQLEAAFKAGTAPTEADLTGYHSGRIYHAVVPDKAFAGVLLGRRITGTDLPADLVPTEFYVGVIRSPHVSADYYDKLTPPKKKDINKVLVGSVYNLPVKFGRKKASASNPYGDVYTIRKNGKYLIAKIEDADNIVKYSYFFLQAQ